MAGKLLLASTSLTALLSFSGCAALQVAGDVQAGRDALQTGRPHEAVSYLTRAVNTAPDYRINYRIPVGALAYLGRAYYETGKDAEARAALEKSLSFNSNDAIAQLYFGLTLLRSGERERGRGEIERSLKAIDDTLEYIAEDRLTGFHWDPGMQIRNDARKTLAVQISDAELAGAAERIGRALDEEIDEARRDEARRRGGSDSSGGGS